VREEGPESGEREQMIQCEYPHKMREIALWPSTNLLIPDILVLTGSESTITEITVYRDTSCCLIKPSTELKYEMSRILYHWLL